MVFPFPPFQQGWHFADIIKDRPGIHCGLVGLVKIPQPGGKPAANDRLRYVVSTLLHTFRHTGDRRFHIRQAEENDISAVQ